MSKFVLALQRCSLCQICFCKGSNYYRDMSKCNKFQFAIDRGGTFTDIHAICPSK